MIIIRPTTQARHEKLKRVLGLHRGGHSEKIRRLRMGAVHSEPAPPPFVGDDWVELARDEQAEHHGAFRVTRLTSCNDNGEFVATE